MKKLSLILITFFCLNLVIPAGMALAQPLAETPISVTIEQPSESITLDKGLPEPTGVVALFDAFVATNNVWLLLLIMVMIGAKIYVASTDTPRDDEIYGKVYKVIEWLAGIYGKSKQSPPNKPKN